MYNHCLELLEQNLDVRVIETLQLVKFESQELFKQLITMNHYYIFNRAMQLGSKSVLEFILSQYYDHQALISASQFKIFSTLIDDKRYDILHIILSNIDLDCRNMLVAKFGEYPISLCYAKTGLFEIYSQAQSFTYDQHLNILKAAITVTNTKTKLNWLNLHFSGKTWSKADLFDCLRIAIRHGNFDAVKFIEIKNNDILKDLLLPEHSYAFVEASRHQKLFNYLLNKLSQDLDQLENVFTANDYAWLHAAVRNTNSSIILSKILKTFQDSDSRTLAITSRNNELYDLACMQKNNDLLEILLSEKTIFEYAIKHFKCPIYDDTLPSTYHLRRFLMETHIYYGHLSKENFNFLASSFNVAQKLKFFYLSIQQKNYQVLTELYSYIQIEASQILFSKIKKEIEESKSLSLVNFLTKRSHQIVLDIFVKELPLFFNFSVEENCTALLKFLHQNFPIQFQDFFKNLTNWQNIVSHFSVEVFELLFKFMDVKDIQPILQQNNYELFYAVLEKGLATTNQWNNFIMLNKLMTEFPGLRVDMVTSRDCISTAIQARDAVAVRNLLQQDKTIFFAVIQQLFENNKKDEIYLLLSLIRSDKKFFSILDYKKPVQLKPQYQDEFISICKALRKHLRIDDIQSPPKLARH